MFGLKFLLPFRALQTFKYRDRASIMSDILASVRTAKEGRRKTQIMQSANLNYIQTKKYLNYMLYCGFIVVTERETYVITAKGSRYLQTTMMERIHLIR